MISPDGLSLDPVFLLWRRHLVTLSLLQQLEYLDLVFSSADFGAQVVLPVPEPILSQQGQASEDIEPSTQLSADCEIFVPEDGCGWSFSWSTPSMDWSCLSNFVDFKGRHVVFGELLHVVDIQPHFLSFRIPTVSDDTVGVALHSLWQSLYMCAALHSQLSKALGGFPTVKTSCGVGEMELQWNSLTSLQVVLHPNGPSVMRGSTILFKCKDGSSGLRFEGTFSWSSQFNHQLNDMLKREVFPSVETLQQILKALEYSFPLDIILRQINSSLVHPKLCSEVDAIPKPSSHRSRLWSIHSFFPRDGRLKLFHQAQSTIRFPPSQAPGQQGRQLQDAFSVMLHITQAGEICMECPMLKLYYEDQVGDLPALFSLSKTVSSIWDAVEYLHTCIENMLLVLWIRTQSNSLHRHWCKEPRIMKQSLSSPWLGDVTMELQDFSDGGCVVQIRMLGEEYFEDGTRTPRADLVSCINRKLLELTRQHDGVGILQVVQTITNLFLFDKSDALALFLPFFVSEEYSYLGGAECGMRLHLGLHHQAPPLQCPCPIMLKMEHDPSSNFQFFVEFWVAPRASEPPLTIPLCVRLIRESNTSAKFLVRAKPEVEISGMRTLLAPSQLAEVGLPSAQTLFHDLSLYRQEILHCALKEKPKSLSIAEIGDGLLLLLRKWESLVGLSSRCPLETWDLETHFQRGGSGAPPPQGVSSGVETADTIEESL